MYKHQLQVKEFHKKFKVVTNTVPTIPDEITLKLRCRLLLEEILEFCAAAGFCVNASNQILVGNGNSLEGETRIRTEEICGNSIDLLQIDITRDKSQTPSIIEMADALADIQYVNDGAALALGIDLEPISNEVHRSNMTKLWKDEECATRPDLSFELRGENSYLATDKGNKVIKSPSYSPANIATELEKQK